MSGHFPSVSFTRREIISAIDARATINGTPGACGRRASMGPDGRVMSSGGARSVRGIVPRTCCGGSRFIKPRQVVAGSTLMPFIRRMCPAFSLSLSLYNSTRTAERGGVSASRKSGNACESRPTCFTPVSQSDCVRVKGALTRPSRDVKFPFS